MSSEFKTRVKNLFNFIFLEHFSVIVCLFALALAGALAYRNAFGAPFIFDDLTQILQNPKIQNFDWPWTFLANNRRPILYASLALNFHTSGFNAFAFHEFNIRVHILAAMMLFFLVRKTLLLPAMKEGLRQNADLLAFASSLLWLLHPIHTQAVTYIIQRAESLMGLFFISALFFSSQYLTSRKLFWLIIAGVASLFAGLTKEVALVLPLMVLFYDRTFISATFREAFRNNCWLYGALSVTWAVMVFLYLTTAPEERLTAGFGMQGMTPFLYAVNQPAVILRYIALAFWPDNLIFDYQWQAVTQWQFLWPSLVVVFSWVLVLIVVYCWNKDTRGVSFLLLSFFIILLPSSSVIPLKDIIFEYRLYLSLSCLSIVFVVALFSFSERYVRLRNRKPFFIIIVMLLAIILGGITYQRNKVYANEEVLWHDVISKQPFNDRAFNNLGEYLMRNGRAEEAKGYFLKAAALNTDYPDVYVNLATVVGKEGDPQKAVEYAQKAIALDPDFAVGHNNLGSALSQLGRYAEAIPHYEKTLELGFVKEGVFQNLALALINTGQKQKAVEVLEKALAIYPDSKETKALYQQILKP